MLAFAKPPHWSDDRYLTELRFPLLATPKIDGIRCLIVNGEAVSRNLKPIPNLYVRSLVRNLPEGFDGELVCPGGFNETQSAIMTQDGTPPFKYRVFDFYHKAPYYERVGFLKMQFGFSLCAFAEPVLYDQVDDLYELLDYERLALEQGYEGVMLRSPTGPYKFGRSTLKEHYLLKLKRFLDAEAVIEDFEELQRNGNDRTTNRLGLSERSSHQAGLVPGETLGALWVRDTRTAVQFSIGSGFDAALRDQIWANRDYYRGRTVTYRYQPSGVKDKPRFPVFKGFRELGT
jgi:DNA ligase-1